MLGKHAYKASAKNIPNGGMPKKERIEMGPRPCNDLGLWVLDNGVGNCKWKTAACKDCFNLKCMIYKDCKKAWSPGGKDDQCWNKATSEAFKDLSRFRLNSRGEPFPNIEQVKRVGQWVKDNPNTLFWIPTRAWQTGKHNGYKFNYEMVHAIESYVMIYPNACVFASVDKDTEFLWELLYQRGWSTMAYNRYNELPSYAKDPRSNLHKCRKTWTKIKNPKTGRPMHPKQVCKSCAKGCFSIGQTKTHQKKVTRIDIWLKYHQ